MHQYPMCPRPSSSSSSFVPPHASALNAETIIVLGPPVSSGGSWLKLSGSVQQMNGFVSEALTPVRCAR